MKKLILLCAAAVLTLCACTGGNGTGSLKKTQDKPAGSAAAEQTRAAELSPEEKREKRINEIISSMTLEEKVWQMFFAAPEDIIKAEAVIAAGETTRSTLDKYPVGGLIYFGRNIKSAEQAKKMISGAQSFSKIPLFTAVDEEGGRVARLGNANIGFPKLPPMAEIGKTKDPQKAYEVGVTLGRELKALGFNVDFAPVADVMTVGNNEDIGNRSFGSDPKIAAEMVKAEVEGMNSESLCSTLKHFPSNGSTKTNTHKAKGVSERTLEQMRAVEFIPFKAGIEAGADFVMAAHMAVPDITGDETPSTLSSVIINDILRKELGFEKIVISDALNMGAITSGYTPEEAAAAAVEAGVDMLLMSPEAPSAAQSVIGAVKEGRIEEDRIDESVSRILGVKIDRGILK